VQGPGKSWNFLGYDNDVGGGQNDAGADAKICMFAHLYRLFRQANTRYCTSLVHNTSGYSAFVYRALRQVVR